MKPTRWIAATCLALAAACASAPVDHDAPLDPAALSAALEADLFGGGSVDLNAALTAGRPVALVFWQAW